MKTPEILLDTYKIKSTLAAGAGGSVYKAWHNRLHKYVTIKELKHSMFVNTESRRNEVEAIKHIKSLYIPQILDFFSDAENSYTIMEYIEGENLNKLLKQHGGFNQYRVLEWYSQLASALVTLHDFDICHGDIKPANIILVKNEKVCLIDFNVAVVKGNDTQLLSRSRGYASPEQYKLFASHKNKNLSKENKVDWKLSDIHNLGATMFHILTGTRMIYDEKGRVSQANFNKKSTLSQCHFIIERSTHPNPNNRFTSALALKRTIQSMLYR
jgi:serine/threonine protein kinase